MSHSPPLVVARHWPEELSSETPARGEKLARLPPLLPVMQDPCDQTRLRDRQSVFQIVFQPRECGIARSHDCQTSVENPHFGMNIVDDTHFNAGTCKLSRPGEQVLQRGDIRSA